MTSNRDETRDVESGSRQHSGGVTQTDALTEQTSPDAGLVALAAIA